MADIRNRNWRWRVLAGVGCTLALTLAACDDGGSENGDMIDDATSTMGDTSTTTSATDTSMMTTETDTSTTTDPDTTDPDTTDPDGTDPDTTDPDTTDPDTTDMVDPDMTTGMCGDGVVDTGETCDGAALGGETCDSQMTGSTGTLACAADCMSFDTTGCTAPVTCGNGVLDTGETCDGTELNGATCGSEVAGTGGEIACAANCMGYDVSACLPVPANCGNGVTEGAEGEFCDGTDFSSLPSDQCADLGLDYTGGTLGCTATCNLDLSGCTGSAVTPPAGWTCPAAYYGDTECDCGCGVIDSDCADATAASCVYCSGPGSCGDATQGCPGTIDPTDNAVCAAIVCGDGVVAGGEECEPTTFADTCADLGAGGTGTPTCNADCTLDVTSCSNTCGDGGAVGADGEYCDGTDFGPIGGSDQCADLGLDYTGGTITCTAGCGIDLSACTGSATTPPAGWTCPAQFYGDSECDCGCGVIDSDCADANATSCLYCAGVGSCGDPTLGSCPGDINPTDNSTCAAVVCGDGVIAGAEECDGTELGGNDCTTIGAGHTGGTLACDSTTCAFDEAACTGGPPAGWTCNPNFYDAADGCDCACGAVDPDCSIPGATIFGCGTGEFCDAAGMCAAGNCGDGTVTPNEDCDGAVTETCADLGAGGGGTVSCDATTCEFDTSACTNTCGDGVIAGAEECEPSTFADTCADLGAGGGGTASCDATTCTIDVSACTNTCGDGVVGGTEWCDGTDLGGLPADCSDGGWFADYTGGTVSCNASCNVDFSACTGNTITAPAGWTCPAGWFGDTFCDCGCGAADSDCADATVGSCDFCANPGSCGDRTQACPSTINATDNSICQ